MEYKLKNEACKLGVVGERWRCVCVCLSVSERERENPRVGGK